MDMRLEGFSKREAQQLSTQPERIENAKRSVIEEIKQNLQGDRQSSENLEGQAESIFQQRWELAKQILIDNLKMNEFMIQMVNKPGYTAPEVERQQKANAGRIERAKQRMKEQFQDDDLMSEESAHQLTILAGEWVAYNYHGEETVRSKGVRIP